MNKTISKICIFASSSDKINKAFFDAADELGSEIAKNGYDIVYGGSTLGLMGQVTKAAKKLGSSIIGVMPKRLYNMGISEGDVTEFYLTEGMRDRKAKMDELSQAVIALAGGFGTLEEASEMLTQKQLGYSNKPIVFLNTLGYYDNLIKFFNSMIDEDFAPVATRDMFYVANSAKEAIQYINNYEYKNTNYLAGKIKIEASK